MIGHVWDREEIPGARSFVAEELLHLLTCTACRNWLVNRLLEAQARSPQEDDTWDERYGAALDRLAEVPDAVLEEVRTRREVADELLQEVIRATPAARKRLLGQRRFQNPDLLDRCLEESHARQLSDPALAQELAETASRVGATLARREEDAADLLPRAFCLAANARRLRHDLAGGAGQLAKAAPVLTWPSDRAFYCRTAALVRWEEGLADDAVALLEFALNLYNEEGPFEEVEVCQALLGLLRLEENRPAEALPHLHRSWLRMERDYRPVLAGRTGFALAFCLALADQGSRARQVLNEAWRCVREVREPAEVLRLYWQEGRTLALLGQKEEARQVLESVFRKLLEEPSPGDAALAALDLALVLAESGRPGEIQALVQDLEQPLREPPAWFLSTRALAAVTGWAANGRPGLEEHVRRLAVGLRRSFRTLGVRLRPFPFA